MSRIVGTVTRATPNTTIRAPQSSQGNRGCFSAVAGGSVIGSDYRSAGEAQRAVQAALGGTFARWSRQDLPGRVEHYIGRTGRPDPREIYGVDLRQWSEADGGVIFLTTGPPKVRLEGDRSGLRNNLTSVVGFEPTLIDTSFGGIPTLVFPSVDAPRMTSPLQLSPATPLTMSFVAAPAGGAVDRILAQIDTSPLQLLVSAGGTWDVITAGPDISGVAALPGVADVAQVVFRPGPPTSVQLYVNDALVGTSTGTFVAGSFLISDAADPWQGALSASVVSVDGDEMKRHQTYLYLSNKYNTA